MMEAGDMRCRWIVATIGVIAMFGSPTAGQDAKNPDGWVEGKFWVYLIGPYSYRNAGSVASDYRLKEPAEALATCRRYAIDSKKIAAADACIAFFYPSTRDLSQAAEARTIYDRNFTGATGSVERMVRALKTDVGAITELRAGATPEALNTIVSIDPDGTAITVGEAYASRYKHDAALVQWLYDRGARLCEKDAGPPAKRFSCMSFYLNDRVTIWQRFDATPEGRFGSVSTTLEATLDVLERNGFRPRSAADLQQVSEHADRAFQGWRNLDRYIALLAPAELARVEAAVAARVAAEKAAEARAAGQAPATPAENLAAARKLSEPGTAVCRPLVAHGTTYRFAATVEGASRTKLQLRAGAIRTDGREITNLPYRDTRISPGVVFWDDAGLWATC